MKLIKENPDGTFTEVSEAWVNRYAFGDRLLEDVAFKVTCKDGEISVSLKEDSYTKTLNIPYWIEEAKQYVMGGEDLSSTPDLEDELVSIVFEPKEKP